MPESESVDQLLRGFSPPPLGWDAFLPILPAAIVIVAGIFALGCEMVQRKRSNTGALVCAIAGVLFAGWALAAQYYEPSVEVFAGTTVRDHLGIVLQALILGSTFLAFLFSEHYMLEKRIAYGEFYALALWAAAGAMIMVSTTNLLMLFLGLEVLSISLYVLAGLSRSEAKSEESALKYLLLGAFASAFLLYGTAFFYGATGGLKLSGIAESYSLLDTAMRGLLVFGLAMAVIGLAFKSALVPFHQWTPDVYQGAPTNVTAFMAAVSKIAAIGALLRILDACLPFRDVWLPSLFWIAVLTMTVGNVSALVQRDVKRLLAYSSIAHAGYILVALLAHAKKPESIGYGSTAFYLLAYCVMTVGAFAVVSLVAKGGREGTRVSDLNGLWRRSPWLAIALVLFMASLIGVPGTAGFVGKLQIFVDSVDAGLVSLAILLAVNSLLSIAYYLRVAMAAFVSEDFDESAPVAPVRPGLALATGLCAIGVIGVFLFASPVMNLVRDAPASKTFSAMRAPE